MFEPNKFEDNFLNIMFTIFWIKTASAQNTVDADCNLIIVADDNSQAKYETIRESRERWKKTKRRAMEMSQFVIMPKLGQQNQLSPIYSFCQSHHG